MQAVADTLEEDVALLGVTGVDDRLQVPSTAPIQTRALTYTSTGWREAVLGNAAQRGESSLCPLLKTSIPHFSRTSAGCARLDANRRQD